MTSAQISALREEVEAALCKEIDNVRRRELHAKVELLRMDLEDAMQRRSVNESLPPVSLAEEDEKVLSQMVSQLHLVPIKRPWKWWYWVDVVFRFVGVCMGFLTVGVFLSLPVILLRGIDALLGLDPFNSLSELLKRSICRFLLILSGVEVIIEGVDRESFKQPCALLTFSHASNLDGFLVSLTCPIRHYAFAKKELFYVPFFSWISIAIGGVPVDRDNRDRAVGTLKRISEAAKRSKMCLVIAPEGTRSLTGQLLPFKKGVSHMWEELKAPIIPVVLYGGWDLYPVGSWVNQCGYVAVRYLKPILPSEVESREHMMRLLRRRMLESLLQCPRVIGSELSWLQRVRCVVVTLLNLLFDYGCLVLFREICFRRLGLSAFSAFSHTLGLVLATTAALYLYTVYVLDFIHRKKKE